MSRPRLVAAALFIAALIAWWFAGYAAADRLGEIAVWAIFAMSLDLITGYAGMVSLGHALFFGLGAYALAAFTLFLKLSPSLAILAAIVVGALSALVIGSLAVRLAGVFFIMITLAFGQMGWAYFLRAPAFGGFGGLSGVGAVDLSWAGLNLANPRDFALAAILLAGLVYLLLARITASPFGRMLVALHQNEHRARALGLPVRRYKLAGFVLAGAIAAFAGALQAERTAFVSPELLVWTTSGEALIMVIIGGLGTLTGPVIGAALWVSLKHYLSSLTPYWMLPMGLFFVAVVLFAGSGVMGLLLPRRRQGADA
jgi:branched-chain amino acid transport system permease protein